MRGGSKPVIWLLIYKKLKPKDMIALGYPMSTVYRHYSRRKEVLDEFYKMMKAHKSGRRVHTVTIKTTKRRKK